MLRDEVPSPANEVHVSISIHDLTHFVTSRKKPMVCYRCGEEGHARYQCLTYKVRLCWHYTNGQCVARNCPFAHGEHELRYPWKPRCVRVVKTSGGVISIGCGSTEHTYHECPHRDKLEEGERETTG